MKRVRYLAGAAGLAPMVLAAVAGGGAHAAADVTGHVGGKAVAPHARPHRGAGPDIVRETCGTIGQDWLEVFQSNLTGEDCFAQAGHENVKIYHIDKVYTGNNGVYFSLTYDGTTRGCRDSFKNTWIYASNSNVCAGFPKNAATMTYLSIYAGTG